MSFLSAVLFLACLPTALMDFAIPAWRSDPSVRIEDAYKWTYQATRGGEHAVPDRESARKWLDNEWQTMGGDANGGKEWVRLCPGGEIGRLNLRPFKAGGGKQEDVLDAFLGSSREYRSEPQAFTDAWAELGKRLKKRQAGAITYKEWLRLDGEIKKKNYPAIHHSVQYNKAYKPAYRIITQTEARRIIPN